MTLQQKFVFPDPKDKLHFTGERYVSGLTGDIQHEHYHRYLFAADFCRNRHVLDIACGEGYGCSLLSQVAEHVIGIDVHPETVAYAESTYGSPNIRFIVSDATQIPLDDDSVDVVASFETIEHFQDHEKFISEIARVLRPGGLLIISSPNRTVYSEQNQHENPFHVRELDREEFRSALSAHFPNVLLLGQRPICGSALIAECAPITIAGFESRDGLGYAQVQGLPSAHYFVAVASTAPLPPIDSSLLCNDQYLPLLRASIARTTAELAEARGRGAELAISLAERQRELTYQTLRMIEMKQSLSWRLTAPFREISSPFRRLRTSRLGVTLAAACRHPGNSDKRKRYRANYMPERLPPRSPRARPTKFAAKLQALAHHPFSSNQRKAYRELWRGMAPSLSLKPGQERTISLKERYRAACATKLTDFLRSNARITLKTSANPEISIIIVLYNGAELTFEHLCSLRDALHVPCEVIFVDNASTDQTIELLSRIDGARKIFNQNNLHFVRAVNQGAVVAKGKCILLLNNDTRINSDSISIANRLLNEDSSIGAVGGKIILLDGTLQEAGSIVWRDGSCSGYGRGRNPSDADFEFRRDVDYCSGAFLMVRRSLFESLGGFDERFAPAYYEETDLCMKLWASGHRVVYDPAIEVTHFEFGSSSSSDEALALQARNHKIFYEIHREMLERHHPAGTSEIRARARPNRRRILVIDDQVPFPQLGAGFPRTADIIKSIHQAGWLVTFYPLRQPKVNFSAVRAVFSPEMEVVANSSVHALKEFLRERAWLFDVVLVSRPHNMVDFRQICDEVPGLQSTLPVIYDAEALFTEREALRRKLYGIAWDDAQHREELSREITLATGAKAIIAVSDREAQLISKHVSNKVYVVGHKRTPTPSVTPWENRKDILFVGSLSGTRKNSPNIDGLYWFVEEVMPLLDDLMGTEYRLVIAGRYESEEVEVLRNGRTAVLGVVDDLRDLYAQSRLFIAPTRFAAGLPYKVHEASALGIPIVATKLIAAQVERVHGKDILVGEDARGFADCCARLYQDKALWERLQSGAIASVARECAPDRFNAVVHELLSDVSGMSH